MEVSQTLIEVIFIIIAFKSFQKPRVHIRDDIETSESKIFAAKWIFHLFLLGTYLVSRPIFSAVAIVFFILQLIGGLWIIINKESFLEFYGKTPVFLDKGYCAAYLIYFGYNLVAFIFM